MGEVVCISALCVSHVGPVGLLVQVQAKDIGAAQRARLGSISRIQEG